jgi:hypothetical protein
MDARHAAARWSLGALAAAAVALPGCFGVRNFENENDALRRKVLELEERARLAEADRDETRVKLAESERVRREALPADVLDALPRCTAIEVNRLSGPDDKDGVAGPETISIGVSTVDGRRRFVQVAGTLRVEATLLPAQLGRTPVLLGSASLGPKELRDSYRYDITGVYYAARVPLVDPNRPLEGTMVMRAELLDALTGQVFKAERVIELGAPGGGGADRAAGTGADGDKAKD